LGGMLRPTELSMIGHITQQALREVRVDKVFLGIRGIDLEAGLTNDYMPEILTDRAILDMGAQVILVADHTKLGRIASAFVAPIDHISTLVTDENANQDILESIHRMGIEVIVAK
jgi:DeoR/GlpR family transcriptional regulator of sugar metabolism